MPTVTLPGSIDRYVYYASDNAYAYETHGRISAADSWSETRVRSSSKRDPSGWRNPTPYSYTLLRSRLPRYDTWFTQGSYRYHVIADADGGALTQVPVPVVDDGLRSRAQVDALLNLKDQHFNAAQAFAERNQTARLVGDSASRIARAFKQAKRGNLKRAADELGASWRKSPRNWLELQYGWKPLLSDVYGACQVLAERNLPQDWRVTVKGKASITEHDSEWYRNGIHGWMLTDRIFQGHFVRMDFVPSAAFLSNMTSLGLTNPLALQWELVPYSFVVDWFLPIGDWLNVMDATSGFRFLAGSHSVLRRSERKIQHKQPGLLEVDSYQLVRDGFSKRIYLTREVLGSPPNPRFPSLKDPVSLGHMANGLSLLAEAFGRR